MNEKYENIGWILLSKVHSEDELKYETQYLYATNWGTWGVGRWFGKETGFELGGLYDSFVPFSRCQGVYDLDLLDNLEKNSTKKTVEFAPIGTEDDKYEKAA